jgi:hypothetical protein
MSGQSRAQLLLANEALEKSIKVQLELSQLAQRCTVLRNAVDVDYPYARDFDTYYTRVMVCGLTRSILPITTLLHQLAPC